MIGCAREKRRVEGESKDDLRARQDFFNFWIWLDESASEWGLPKTAAKCRSPERWLEGGSDSEMGVSLKGFFGKWGRVFLEEKEKLCKNFSQPPNNSPKTGRSIKTIDNPYLGSYGYRLST